MKNIVNLICVVWLFSAQLLTAQEAQKWDDWQPTHCYHNIEYRAKYVRANGERHEWQIQFKNNYTKQILFNYGTSENSEGLAITTHRKTLKPGATSEPVEIYTQGDEFYVFVDGLSFDIDGSRVIECENDE